MMANTIRAPAKVNLRLRVLGREVSGYHSLETLFLALDLADEIDIEPGPPGVQIEVDGPDDVPADRSNLCSRAAHLFAEATGVAPSVRIRLKKTIPSGAGLGGGSSDAASVLVALNRAAGSPLDSSELGRLGGTIGSDVPFFVSGAAMAIGWERGRRILPVPAPPSRPVLVVVPPDGLPTAEAYGWLTEDESRRTARAFEWPEVDRLDRWDVLESLATNDFERVVFRKKPELEEARDALRQAGAAIAMLSGSGSCLFGVFRDTSDLDAADTEISSRQGLRTIRTTTAS